MFGQDFAATVGSLESGPSVRVVAAKAPASSVEEVFAVVIKHGLTGSEYQKHLYAIYSAVADVLKEQKQQPTPTAYFAVLMTSLSGQTTKADAQVIAAQVYLLQIAMGSVSHSILRSKFGDIAAVFERLVADHLQQAAVIKSLLACIAILLAAQELPVWKQRTPLVIFQLLLALCLDERPKVRHVAQDKVAVLIGSKHVGQPGLAAVLNFSTHFIEATQGTECHAALAAIPFLAKILPSLPSASVRAICDALLRLPTIGNPLLTQQTFACFQTLFEKATQETFPTPKYAMKLLQGLSQLQPSRIDPNPTIQYANLMKSGYLCLHRLDRDHALLKLPSIFAFLIDNLLSDSTAIVEATAKALLDLIEGSIDEETVSHTAAHISNNESSAGNVQPPLVAVLSAVGAALAPSFRSSWMHVLRMCSLLFQKLGKHAHSLMSSILLSIDRVHSSVDLREDSNLPLSPSPLLYAINATLGAAVDAMGAPLFLSILPLNLVSNKGSSKERAWLLPILQDHISNSSLGYFFSDIVPLAAQMKEHSQAASQAELPIVAKKMHVVYHQLWGLFPRFCTQPTDLPQVFPRVAKLLGTTLTDDSELRHIVCTGIQSLIQHAKQPGTDQGEDSSTAILAGYAKNFIPCLFNLYNGHIPPELRNTVLNTIEKYLSITDAELVNTFYRNVIQRLLESGKEKKQEDMESDASASNRYLLSDLVVPFVPYLALENLQFLWRLLHSQLKEHDDKLQKKTYRILEQICQHHASWVMHHKEALGLIASGVSTASASSTKKSRLLCIGGLIKGAPENQTAAISDFIGVVMGEVLMCTKEPNSKTRSAAFDLLVSMGNRMCVPVSPETKLTGSLSTETVSGKSSKTTKTTPTVTTAPTNVTPFLLTVVAGLAGSSTHMMSATLSALARLIFEFRDRLEVDFVSELVGSVVVLLGMRSREVVKAAFGFLKVCLSCLPPALLIPHLPGMVPGMLTWAGEAKKQRFRSKAKILLDRLIRKFGYEEIAKLVPEQHSKLLQSVKKEQQDKKKTKQDRMVDEEEEEEEGKGKGQGTRKDMKRRTKEEKAKAKKKEAAWIVESDTPIDFTDPRSVQHVVSTNPKGKTRRRMMDEDEEEEEERTTFKMDDLGRMIITEEEEKESREKPNRKRTRGAMETDASADKSQAKATKDKKARGPPNKRQKGSTETEKTQRGDKMPKSGGVQPYSYVPLDPKNLNKRRQAQVAGKFKNLVKAAEKGSKGGKQARARRMKSRNL